MERPRTFLKTLETNSTTYVDLLNIEISPDAKGVSYLTVSIDPDPNARYHVTVAKILEERELEITAVWTAEYPHLTSGVYEGINPTDRIMVRHRSTDVAITVKTGITLHFNEVIEEERVCVPPKARVEK